MRLGMGNRGNGGRTPIPLKLGSVPHFLLAVCAMLLLSACSRAEVFRHEAFVFGTRVDVAVYGDSQAEADAAAGAVLREFDRLHRAYHAWEPSELTVLNAALARGETATVSDELAAMLKDAQQIAATGDQLFNPALGGLIALWGFHTDNFVPQRPDPAQLQALLDARPSMADLVIDGNRVSSRNPAVQLDLGGYAKGYALDRAAAILRENGVANALINIGGNVMALGKKGDQPWRIGIQHPRTPAPLATLPLYDGEAVGTSGDYQRYFEQWREHPRRFGIEHVLRVAADGRVEVTRALRARLQFPAPIEVTVVD